MADFVEDFVIDGRDWVDITAEPNGTGFAAQNIVIQNKSHIPALVWFGSGAPSDDSQGYVLTAMGKELLGTVVTKLWVRGVRVHVSITD